MVDWHARSLIRSAREVLARDEAEGGSRGSGMGWDRLGRRHAAAAEGLLRLRHSKRRQACGQLLAELLDRTVRLRPAAALTLLATRLGEHGDVLTSDRVDRVVRTAVESWDGPWQTFPGGYWQQLAQTMDAVGMQPPLWERVTRHLGRSDATEHRAFREGLSVSLLHAKGEPRIALLVELGVLDEAGWWCQFGDVAFLADRWEPAALYWRRANELGHPEVAPRVAALALSRVVEEVGHRLGGVDGPDDPERDPEDGVDHTRPWRQRDEVLGLIREARELDQDWCDENRFCLLACGLALGMEAEFGVDPDELPGLDVEDDEVLHFWLGFLALRGGRTEQAREAFAAAVGIGLHWEEAQRLVEQFLAASAGGQPVSFDYRLRSAQQNDGFVCLLPEPVLPRSPLDQLTDGEEGSQEADSSPKRVIRGQ